MSLKISATEATAKRLKKLDSFTAKELAKKHLIAGATPEVRYLDLGIHLDSKLFSCTASGEIFSPLDPNVTKKFSERAFSCKGAIEKVIRTIPVRSGHLDPYNKTPLFK